jgi:hypothetical protein
MGFRFRRSFKVAPGVRVNVGKKSVGISAGVRGARISTNSRTGTQATVGLPGTGLSYSQKIGGKAPQRQSPQAALTNSATNSANNANLQNRHLVQISANVVRWPWLCACCSIPLQNPPLGASIISNSHIYEVKMNAKDLSAPYCDTCNHHRALAHQAQCSFPPPLQSSSTYTVAGSVLSFFVWLVSLIFWQAVTSSFGFAFFMAVIFGTLTIIGGIYLDKNTNDTNLQQAEYAHNFAAGRMQDAINAMTPHCTCSHEPAVIVESHQSLRTFYFTHDKIASAFAKLNQNKIVHGYKLRTHCPTSNYPLIRRNRCDG